MTVMLVGMPVVFLLLFVYVFGGTLGAGLGGVAGGRADYVDYVAPGDPADRPSPAAAQGTAISVAMDMTEGIIARFRTMAIARVSVLTGHVARQPDPDDAQHRGRHRRRAARRLPARPPARSSGSPRSASWRMVTFALTWLSVALGLVSKSVETASNLPMPLMLLPFLGSGFVPTDSMPAGLRWFAEYQPFTPIIETLRGLLLGTPIGNSAMLAVAWCAGIALGRLPVGQAAVQPRPDAVTGRRFSPCAGGP